MLIISNVYLGTRLRFCVLPGSFLGMSGWLVRSLLLANVPLGAQEAHEVLGFVTGGRQMDCQAR